MYDDWSGAFSIEFDIRVDSLPNQDVEVLNVFRFTATEGDNNADGNSIPELMVSHEGFFMFHNDANYLTKFEFDIGTVYHVRIQQLKEHSVYWYEIIINGESIMAKQENGHVKSYPTVSLYAGWELCLSTIKKDYFEGVTHLPSITF